MTSVAQQPGATSTFTLDKSITVPGTTLKPGSYTASLLDTLTDRAVIQVSSPDGRVHLLLLAVRGAQSKGAGQPVYWDEKAQQHHALRGFTFADGRSYELVYPKADAVALAKANHSSVVAVDTASEGRPELSKLSSRDMQMVSLWLLTPTRVGPDQSGIAAKKYEAPGGGSQTTASSSTPPAQTAASQPATMSSASRSGAVRTSQTPHPVMVASNTRDASVARLPKRLPQTASQLPLVWMLSSVAAAGAALLRMRRITGERA